MKIIATHWPLYLTLSFYALAAFLLFPFYQYQINPDGVNYISLADQYREGLWRDAITRMWAPLLSWLLIPFLAIGMEQLLAMRILLLFCGAGAITAVYFFLFSIHVATVIRIGALFGIVIPTLYYSFSVITPDLLVVFFFFLYLGLLYRLRERYSFLIAALIGLTAGFGYLSKHYFLPFFLVHFSLYFFLTRYHLQDIRKSFFVFSIAIGVFLAVASPWIIVMSISYNEFTFGPTNFVHAIISPQERGKHIYGSTLYTPRPHAYSVAEDPTFIRKQDWSIFESKETLRHQMRIMRDNLISVASVINHYSTVCAFIIITVIFFLFLRKKASNHGVMLFMFGSALLYGAGYLLFYVEERYFWPLYYALVIVVAILFDSLKGFFSHQFRFRCITIFCVSFIAVLTMYSFQIRPIQKLISMKYIGTELIDLANLLTRNGVRGKIASNDQWEKSLHLSYYLNSQYYGMTRNIDDEDTKIKLREFGITHYFIWPDTDKSPAFLSEETRMIYDTSSGLVVYGLK